MIYAGLVGIETQAVICTAEHTQLTSKAYNASYKCSVKEILGLYTKCIDHDLSIRRAEKSTD